ncbi:PAS domain-containing protein [Litoreibacter sp.]|nr:PAS domain-containing protein [Litoreibacter sp.]
MLPVIENVSTIEELMDVIDQPMFLLDVSREREFRFRGLNLRHQQLSGMHIEDIKGRRPADVLPARLADSLVNNFEQCRASGQSTTYEELLDLPGGQRWWQTTLSPICDAFGQVCVIVGLAFDISQRKTLDFTNSEKLSEMTRLNEDLQVFAASTAQDLRGPFQTMAALLELVREGFVDLGDEKSDQLALCQEIAETSILKMSKILDIARKLQVQKSAVERIDLHHLLCDIAALLDPHQRLNMTLPQAILETDRVALQMVLRNVMENAVRYADSRIMIEVAPQMDGTIAITVADDGVSDNQAVRCDGEAVLPASGTSPVAFGLASAAQILTSRGGKIEQIPAHYETGAAIKISLPGCVTQ